eukprot:275176_1
MHVASQVQCICGSNLVEILTKDAYSGQSVLCDICGSPCESNDKILHCTVGKEDNCHSGGYDTCSKCSESLKASLQPQSQNCNIEELVDKLTQEGFSESISCKALQAAKYDFNTALEFLSSDSTTIQTMTRNDKSNEKASLQNKSEIQQQMLLKILNLANGDTKIAIQMLEGKIPINACLGNIETCSHLKYFKKILNENHETDQIDIEDLLNNFYHLLQEHSSDDEFEFIYNKMNQCDINKCAAIRRNRRRRQKNKNTPDETKVNVEEIDPITDILDQMHCHYVHCFDIGCKLTQNEKNMLCDIKENAVEDEFEIFNQCLQKKCKILFQKRTLSQHIVGIPEYNKFNENNTGTNVDESKNEFLGEYDYGFRYYYWDPNYKNKENPNFVFSKSSCTQNIEDWCLKPRFHSFKKELVSNNVAVIYIEQYNSEISKVTRKFNTKHCKSLQSDHVYDIPKGQPIGIHHLLSIAIYCNFDIISYEFSGTFRKVNNSETDKSLKERHSNFYYLSKYIHEAVNVYSKAAICNGPETTVPKVYHGVDKKMIFRSMDCIMNQPFSTTSKFSVAVNFSSTQGMILKMKPAECVRYFHCDWISDYSNEHELLFIATNATLSFQNIIMASPATDYTFWIECLTIIDTLFNGTYYANDDGSVYKKFLSISIYQQQQSKKTKMNPIFFGGRPISVGQKYVVIKIIKHQLNKYDDTKYNKFKQMPKYVDELFHHICLQKRVADVIWPGMQIEMTNIEFDAGYCGYSFLKQLFCNKDFLDLNCIASLYPNLRVIGVFDLASISPFLLDIVWNFFQTNEKTKIVNIQLRLCNDSKYVPDVKTLEKLLSKSVIKFRQNGFKVTFNKSRAAGKIGLHIDRIEKMHSSKA